MTDWMAPYRGRLEHSVEFRLPPQAPWWLRLIDWLSRKKPPQGKVIIHSKEPDDA
jgi:hypothetical protein